MTLALLARERRAELRADFRQYYGLDFDAAGEGYTYRHAADLAAMLPSASRTFVALNPDNAWTLSDRILARIEYWCHTAAWMQTKDGQKGANRPEPLFGGGRSSAPRRGDAVALDVSDYARILSMPRKEASHGD